jgi:mannan endo-1,4-beta-mannosidase
MIISSTPADAAVRQHRAHAKHARKVARFSVGLGRTHSRRHHGHVTGGGQSNGASGTGATGTGTQAGTASASASASTSTSTAGADPKFGVFTDDSPYGGNVDNVEALQSKLGRHIDIVNWYQNWEPGSWAEQFHPDVLNAVTHSGRTPLLTWEPWTPGGADQPRFRLRRIAEGDFDAYIASWADQLKATGTDVYLRPMHEMNGNWYPWGATIGDNTPELYIRAWRRMVDIFRDHGATNVKFVWCPVPFSVPDKPGNQLEDYYPGTRYVDVLSLDGYNWGSTRPEYGGWQSFDSIFRAAYHRLTKLGPQPVWIAEVASAPEGGNKTAWVRDMWASARTMPRLEALVWFDQHKEEDWSILPAAPAFAA